MGFSAAGAHVQEYTRSNAISLAKQQQQTGEGGHGYEVKREWLGRFIGGFIIVPPLMAKGTTYPAIPYYDNGCFFYSYDNRKSCTG